MTQWLRTSRTSACIALPMLLALAGPVRAQQLIGYVNTRDADISGATDVLDGQAVLTGSVAVTARDHTAPITLGRGGTVRVCQTSVLHLTESRAVRLAAPLLFSLDRGAIEIQMIGTPNDSIMTPDLRFTVRNGGPLDLRMRVARNGDTCVENRGSGAPTLSVSDPFGEALYEIAPGQHILFEHASLRDVVDHETSACGCPDAIKGMSVADALLASGGPKPPAPPSAPPATRPAPPATAPPPPAVVQAPPPVAVPPPVVVVQTVPTPTVPAPVPPPAVAPKPPAVVQTAPPPAAQAAPIVVVQAAPPPTTQTTPPASAQTAPPAVRSTPPAPPVVAYVAAPATLPVAAPTAPPPSPPPAPDPAAELAAEQAALQVAEQTAAQKAIDAAERHPFPAAISEGLAPVDPAPPVPPGQPRVQITDTLSYTAPVNAVPATPGSAASSRNKKATPAIPATPAPPPTPPPPAAAPPPNDLAHFIGRFFRRLFGGRG